MVAKGVSLETNERKTNQSEVALCCRLRFVALLGCNSSEQNLFWGGRKLIFLNKWLCLFTMKQKRLQPRFDLFRSFVSQLNTGRAALNFQCLYNTGRGS